MSDSHPEPDFAWLLKARSAIQQEMLDLLNFGKTNRDALLQGGDDSWRSTFALLVGTAFSLWRAAFLSDMTRSWPEVIDKANDLLKTVLITNSVPFSTDRQTRNWMMGYYLNNARFRLADARDKLGDLPQSDALQRFAELHPHGIANIQVAPTDAWDVFKDVLDELLEALKLKLKLAGDLAPTGGLLPPAV